MTITRREVSAWILALGSGLAIVVVDSRPTWDDAGITAAALVACAAVSAIVAGRRPWLIALLVGLPTPLFEVPMRGEPLAFVAVAFAAVGALCGFLVSRVAQPEQLA